MEKTLNEKKDRRVQLTQKQKEWIYLKWCQGYTQRELAEAIGASQNVIWYALQDKQKKKPKLVAPFRYKGIKGGVLNED